MEVATTHRREIQGVVPTFATGLQCVPIALALPVNPSHTFWYINTVFIIYTEQNSVGSH